jgi:hypothetical protein
VVLVGVVIHDGCVDDEALTRMQEAAALWSVGQVTATHLVDAACELLMNTSRTGLPICPRPNTRSCFAAR